jgi:uncharacterized RDD family membrane protein YckC
MKCPKCGYLGFETTDRCRNCQYDFSLTPFSSEPELTLHGAEHRRESANDFDLPPIKRQTDALSATALDLDRLFGDAEAPKRAQPSPVFEPPPVAPEPEPELATIDMLNAAPEFEVAGEPEPVMAMASAVEPEPDDMLNPGSGPTFDIESDEAALPFDDAPLMPPPAARTPLAVRRSTPDIPRNRPRTTRPVRVDSLLNLEDSSPKSSEAANAATDTVALLLEMPSLGVRVGAGLIDLVLLVGIDAAVLYLTLRVTGLQNSIEDLRVLPPIPFIGFLAVLAFGYVSAFTVAGGQTIGKMALSLRVIGDDGRPVDAAGGMLRALGCMLVPITLGLSYLPALFTSDHRALHDRLAGTRVVQE